MLDRCDGAHKNLSTIDLSLGRRSRQLEKLDCLHWPAVTGVTVFSVRIGIRANAPEFLHALTSRIPSGCGKAGSTPIDRLYSIIGNTGTHPRQKRSDCNFLFADGGRIASRTTWENLYDAFEADLEFFVAAKNRNFLFVHAGAVSWKGQGIIIPGESQSGKTTLVQAFLALGATYYSDEFAVLDSDGQLHPFPRALHIRSNLGFTKISAANFGAPTAVAPVPVQLVILTRHVPALSWRPKRLSQGQGILGLIKNTLAARRYPDLALGTLEKATQSADVLVSARGEANDTAQWVVRHLSP